MLISTKLQEEKSSSFEKCFQICIPIEEVNKSFHNAYQKMQGQVQLKGFRHGKIPRQHIWNLYGEQITGESTRQMAVAAYVQVLEEQKLSPLGDPHFDIQKKAKEGEAFDFKVQFELYPKLPSIEYSPLNVTAPPPPTEQEVEKKVEATLKNLCENSANYEEVKDHNVKVTEDHIAVLDLSATNEKGEKLKEFDLKDFRLNFKHAFISKEFNGQILGMKRNESKKFELKLNANTVHFLVEIKALNVKSVPKLTKEFVQEKFGQESVEALRETVKSEVTRQDREMTSKKLEEEVLSALLKKNPFALPPKFLKIKQEKFIKSVQQDLKQQGMDEKQIETYWKEQNQEEQLKTQVERDIKTQIILSGLAEQKEVYCTDEDLKKALQLSNPQEDGEEKRKEAQKFWDFLEQNAEKKNQLRFRWVRQKVLDLVLKESNLSIA